jgi:hypothetical protein
MKVHNKQKMMGLILLIMAISSSCKEDKGSNRRAAPVTPVVPTSVDNRAVDNRNDVPTVLAPTNQDYLVASNDPELYFNSIPGCNGDLLCADGNGNYRFPRTHAEYYTMDDLKACVEVIRDKGRFPVRGAWLVDDNHANFSNLGNNITVRDVRMVASWAPRLVVMNLQNYLTMVNYEFLDPMSIYCVKNTSKVSIVSFSSCYPNNIAILNDSSNGWNIQAEVLSMQCINANPLWMTPQPFPYP